MRVVDACGQMGVGEVECPGVAGGLTSTGLVPAVISPFVTQKIGLAHASRYFLTAETFNASTAEKMSTGVA